MVVYRVIPRPPRIAATSKCSPAVLRVVNDTCPVAHHIGEVGHAHPEISTICSYRVIHLAVSSRQHIKSNSARRCFFVRAFRWGQGDPVASQHAPRRSCCWTTRSSARRLTQCCTQLHHGVPEPSWCVTPPICVVCCCGTGTLPLIKRLFRQNFQPSTARSDSRLFASMMPTFGG
ncbi:hypothetical protein CCHOA_05160 [Corynebacterium choanae]|uniref:Uncharacterized protein n=1 Tax=Corynebacterium choanae TaxID=1862358 RepID=A0A3G6J5V1_9CORY|nr:hypothetical protein CCHOA_05160 [Corynebacterium choanae]